VIVLWPSRSRTTFSFVCSISVRQGLFLIRIVRLGAEDRGQALKPLCWTKFSV